MAWASRISSRLRDDGSAVTPNTWVRAVTSFVGEACVASLGETGSSGTFRRSDAMSMGELRGDRSEGLSVREWSGRKRSGADSALGPSAGNASHETGMAAGVGVARRHC